MIDELVGGCLTEFGHWILAVVFLIAAPVVLVGAGDQIVFRTMLAGLLLYTSAMLIVGFGLGKAKRFFALSWFILLVGFIGAAALLHKPASGLCTSIR
jgi:hypothetical protein